MEYQEAAAAVRDKARVRVTGGPEAGREGTAWEICVLFGGDRLQVAGDDGAWSMNFALANVERIEPKVMPQHRQPHQFPFFQIRKPGKNWIVEQVNAGYEIQPLATFPDRAIGRVLLAAVIRELHVMPLTWSENPGGMRWRLGRMKDADLENLRAVTGLVGH